MGGGTAKRLAGEGARVAIFDLNDELGTDLANEIGGVFIRVNVTDEDAVVRIAAAGRSELPKEVLARLRKDANSEVVRAVKQNPSYKPGFFEKLFD